MAKAKILALDVPQTEGEADELLRQLGNVMRRRTEINVRLNDAVEVLQQRTADEDQPLGEEQEQLVRRLAAFAEANRERLAKGKTIELPSGSFSWRLTPFKVNITKVADVLKELKRRRLKTEFIRVKEEINKEAMLRDQVTAAKVPGVTITQHEELYIKPTDLESEVMAGRTKMAA